jgi:hypothetical protein
MCRFTKPLLTSEYLSMCTAFSVQLQDESHVGSSGVMPPHLRGICFKAKMEGSGNTWLSNCNMW